MYTKFQALFTNALTFLSLQTIILLSNSEDDSSLFHKYTKLAAHTHSYHSRTHQTYLFSGFLILEGNVPLSVTSRNKQPQQLLMVPRHKAEDGEKSQASVLTIVSNFKWKEIKFLAYTCSISRASTHHLH